MVHFWPFFNLFLIKCQKKLNRFNHGNRLQICEASFLHFTSFNTDIVASDFEEHLGHGLGKNATVVLKFRLWQCIVEERGPQGEGKERGWWLIQKLINIV